MLEAQFIGIRYLRVSIKERILKFIYTLPNNSRILIKSGGNTANAAIDSKESQGRDIPSNSAITENCMSPLISSRGRDAARAGIQKRLVDSSPYDGLSSDTPSVHHCRDCYCFFHQVLSARDGSTCRCRMCFVWWRSTGGVF